MPPYPTTSLLPMLTLVRGNGTAERQFLAARLMMGQSKQCSDLADRTGLAIMSETENILLLYLSNLIIYHVHIHNSKFNPIHAWLFYQKAFQYQALQLHSSKSVWLIWTRRIFVWHDCHEDAPVLRAALLLAWILYQNSHSPSNSVSLRSCLRANPALRILDV